MSKYLQFIIAIVTALCVSACCSSQKNKNTPAKDAMPDRNIKDPKIDSLNKRVEVINIEPF